MSCRSYEELADWLTLAVFRYEHGPTLDDVGRIGRNPERAVDRRVQVFHHDRVLDRGTGPLVGGTPVDESLLDASPEHQQRPGSREVAMHAVVARLGHHVGNIDG